MDDAAPLTREKPPVKTGTVARRGARVHQEYRQLSVFTRKPKQTRRFAAERGFLRCDCGLRHKQPAEPAPRRSVEGDERVSSPRHSLDPPCYAFNAAAPHWRDSGG